MPYLSPQTLSDEQLNSQVLKQIMARFSDYQKHAFFEQRPIAELVLERSDYLDALLQRLWGFFGFDLVDQFSLVAVGGYGRRELHPLSDIDILLVSTHPITPHIKEKVSRFITLLWDLHLDVGHAVRTIGECIEIGRKDLTVATNLQEARFIAGSQITFHTLLTQVDSPSFWPSDVFFRAKVAEQQERHARYHNTSYNLEPDIKLTPGGLRDIHTLSWIARRHFGARSLYEMSHYGFLTLAEYHELLECQHILWRVRFALHLELKHYDNRLVFAHQAQVARTLGYQGEGNQAVETMMKTFYRTLGTVAQLNTMLLTLFEHAILNPKQDQPIELLDDHFQARGHWIEARQADLFHTHPDKVLTLFWHMAQQPRLTEVAPETLRQLRNSFRHLTQYLNDIPKARTQFIAITRHPNALNVIFTHMHNLGVLAAYFPQWQRIVGQMQFDLFHAYTVDEHSIRLLKHIRLFSDPKQQEKHPICCQIYPELPKKELLILAALFHDIGKGQGGDHSLIGAQLAKTMCLAHGLSLNDAKLVAWLVEHHLLMSVTAQRRDIYDMDVILEFAQQVGSKTRLNYLLCLTVADICATNPALWNSWKRSLLMELYQATERTLKQGLEHPLDRREHIRHTQQAARELLEQQGFSRDQIDTLWQHFHADYFLRHPYEQIAWHGSHLLTQTDLSRPIVQVSQKATRGGTEIFVYTQDQPALFATVVAELDRRNLSVHEAQIMTSKDGYAFDTFIVLDHQGQAIDESRHKALSQHLVHVLEDGRPTRLKTRRPPTNLRHFNVDTQVDFLATKGKKRTLMELIALDTPGLLATVGATFSALNLNLHAAKISTIGERAEDLFILTSAQGTKLNDEEQAQLRDQLLAQIKQLQH